MTGEFATFSVYPKTRSVPLFWRMDNVDALREENVRLRRAVEELSILNDLATAIGGTNDVTKIMQIIVRRSLKTVHAEQGVVTLIDHQEEVDALRTLVRTMTSTGHRAALHPDESILGYIMRYSRPVVINNPQADDRFAGVHWDESVRSILCVPMLAQSRLMGALTVYNKKDAGGFTEADQRLISILAAQSAQVLENARLQEEQSTMNHLQEELRLARDIQGKLLPQESPELKGFELAGTSIPAESVGGDFYDFLPLDANRVCLWVGDVAGKGLPASLTMATTQATLRGESASMRSVADCVAAVNRHLCANTTRGTFVTLFFGLLDLGENTLTYVNAGHNRPVHVRADGRVEKLELGDLVLGVLPNAQYREGSLALATGESVVVYSDGVTESMSPLREQYEEDRLNALLQSQRELAADAMVNAILESVEAHSADAPQADDLTVAILKRTDA